MSSKPKVYIRIGYGKTASTFTGSVLTNSEEQLANNGVYYLKEGRDGLSHRPLVSWIKHNELSFDQLDKKKKVIEQEIYNSQASKILLTSEVFITLLPEKVKQLQYLFSSFETHIICFVRYQPEAIITFYAQLIRGFGVRSTQRFSAYLLEFDFDRLNYPKRMQRWEPLFGKQNIHIKLYEKNCSSEQVIVDLFETIQESTLGKGLSTSFNGVEENHGPPVPAIEFARQLNSYNREAFNENSWNNFIKKTSLENSLRRPLKNQSEFDHVIRSYYAESNQLMSQEYTNNKLWKSSEDLPPIQSYLSKEELLDWITNNEQCININLSQHEFLHLSNLL